MNCANSLLIFLLICAGSIIPVSDPAAEPQKSNDEHEHQHEKVIERPKVFLDKSPKIVEYQLKRLENARLLLVERETTDRKYIPVYRAILLRPGMSKQLREESLAALAILNQRDQLAELFDVLQSLDSENREQSEVGRQLTVLLQQFESIRKSTREQTEFFRDQSLSNNPLVRTAALSGLLTAGETETAWEASQKNQDALVSWLHAVSAADDSAVKSAERSRVLAVLEKDLSASATIAAIHALGDIQSEQSHTFQTLAGRLEDSALRGAVVRAMLKVPSNLRDSTVASQVLEQLIWIAENTPADQRTTDDFIDAMTLAEQLLIRIPAEQAMAGRERLRSVSVRVVRIRTVHEEMRYDTPYFAVEAGRPVQLILQNDDLMPHNLVVTKSGMLKEVAESGAVQGSSPGYQGLPFVPATDAVMFATGMVDAGKTERLTFTAPAEPGEYPYVCTFPRHWMRMYGVMVVVKDLDAWQRNPVAPKDPLGNTRLFVRNWTIRDFDDRKLSGSGDSGESRGSDPVELSTTPVELSTTRGQSLFKEATCLQCHRMHGQGGQVGPELTDVLTRMKGDRMAVLKEILDPSWKIDPKYVVQVVVTTDGRSHSGIIQSEDEQSISLLSNPEAMNPEVINRKDIEEIVPSSISMMPKALLDKFSEDEILHLLHYLTQPSQPESNP